VLRLHYNGRITLTPLQVRSAQAAIGFERPKLEAVAVAHLDGDFGEMLDRAVERSAAARLEVPTKVIDAKPVAKSKAAEVSSERITKSFPPFRRRI
jgi:hypothetical protein